MREVASQITCPLFIVSGALDRVIPSDHAAMLEKAAVNAAEIIHLAVPDGGHVVNNRAYKYRQASADWMAQKMRS
jgi:2,6-dihydroxypseudooxynicotine hydrolase